MIRPRSGRLSAILALTLATGLAGCNATSAPAVQSPSPAASATDAGPQPAPVMSLPAGEACTGAINRWRAVIDHDYQAGYSDPSVYKSIQKDIANEQNACAAGHDAQAVGMVQKSRRSHGYPPDKKI